MNSSPKRYDVAISFAGTDRHYAKEIADALLRCGISVFYDEYEKANLWGKNLYTYLADLYKNKAIYCIILFSEAYMKNIWAQHELKAAQARSLEDDEEYILPIRLGDTEIPDTVKSIGYLSWPPETSETIGELLQVKLGRATIAAAPLWEMTPPLFNYQLPDSLRIAAIGPPEAGKSIFFLYLVNALLECGRYSPISMPDKTLENMSSLLLDIRKSKIPDRSIFETKSEIIITLEDRQLKKWCSLEVYGLGTEGEDLCDIEELRIEKEKLIMSDVLLLFIPSNDLEKAEEILLRMVQLLEESLDRHIVKPIAIIFTKWDLIRGQLSANFRQPVSDESLLMKLLTERFQRENLHIKSNFKNHAYFYFSAKPLLRDQSLAASPDGLPNILTWILNQTSRKGDYTTHNFLRRLEIFIQNWRRRRSKKKV